MYAIIATGGKQYKVCEGDKIRVERLAAEVGSQIEFDQVLLIGGEAAKVGSPLVDGGPTIRHQKPLTSAQQERVHECITQAENVSRSALLPVLDNDSCGHCGYQSICPRMEQGRIFS